jgi:hypothetical protein
MSEASIWDEPAGSTVSTGSSGLSERGHRPGTILDEIEAFLGRFVAYPSEAARIAHVLWIAHAHLMDAWESTPRIAFLSPEPGSGKSRALEVTELLVPRPLHAVNASPAALFRVVSDDAGPPTILFDEIDTVFGPRAKDNEDIRGMLNAGHRRGATALRCVIRGKEIETVEFPAYCAVALAGLDDLPDTIATRSIIVRMRRRAPGEVVEPFRHRLNAPEGNDLRERIEAWCSTIEDQVSGAWPTMPEGIEDRNADVWEALLACADAAGGEWPERARRSAVALVAESKGDTGSLGIRLLADIRKAFADDAVERMATDVLLGHLVNLDEAPWGDLRGKPLDARGLSRRLAKYNVAPKNQRIDGRILKGYEAADLTDPWSRYLPAVAAVAPPYESKENLYLSSRGGVAVEAHPVADSSATSATPLQVIASEQVVNAALERLVLEHGMHSDDAERGIGRFLAQHRTPIHSPSELFDAVIDRLAKESA